MANCDISVGNSHLNMTEEDSNKKPVSRRSSAAQVTNSTTPEAEQLELIVKCPIHLGILRDPRKLSCQHAFCRECLDEILQHTRSLSCPICRREEPMPSKGFFEASMLPKALCENQLVVYLRELLKRNDSRTNLNSILIGSTVSLSGSANNFCGRRATWTTTDLQLVDQAAADTVAAAGRSTYPSNRTVSLNENNCNNTEELMTVINSVSNMFTESRSQIVDSDNFLISNYDMLDVETIRENMLAYADYKVQKQHKVKKICRSLYSKKGRLEEVPECHTFDVDIKNHQLLLVCSKNSKCVIYSDNDSYTFYIRLQRTLFQPVFIRTFLGDLYATGFITCPETGITKYFFLQTNFSGKVIRKSECYQGELGNFKSLILGFDANVADEQYFVCFPPKNCIKVFGTALMESTHFFQFESSIHPEYAAFYPQQNQLWVSCPSDRRILIVEISSGAFRQLNTDQINAAVPTVICCTDDERIIFLDDSTNRFIWIRRRNDYILTQRLNLHWPALTGPEPGIRNFQPLTGSMLIVNTGQDITLFRPYKLYSESSDTGRSHSCTII